MAAFLTCRAVRKRGNTRPYSQSRKKSEERCCKKRGNARPYSQSRKKSEETRCKNRKILLGRILKVEKKVKTLKRCVVKLGRLCLFGNGKTHLLFRLCLECSHKMEMRYSEEGTLGPLGQQQRYPLPARSLQ